MAISFSSDLYSSIVEGDVEGYKGKLRVQLLSVPLAISPDTDVEFFVF